MVITGSTCPICGAAHAPSDVRCQVCGAQVDALLVDLAEPAADAARDEPTGAAPRRTREVLTVVGVLLGLAVGAGFLFSSGGDPDPIPVGALPGNTDGPLSATPAPFPTPPPFPTPTLAPTPTPTPTPEGAGESVSDEVAGPELTDLAPLLGDVSGLSLAWRGPDGLHILDLDSGTERQVAIPSSSVDFQVAAVGDRIVTRLGNQLTVLDPDGRIRDLTIPGGVDHFLAADDGIWVNRYPRSEQDVPEVAFVGAGALVVEEELAWRELPRFAYVTTVSSRGLLVGLWQGRPFLLEPGGTFEQLPYDGVLAATGDHLLTYSCEGGIELRCEASLVDEGTGSVTQVAVDTSQPWSWRLAPGGRYLYWMNWSTDPVSHWVTDLATGEVDEIEATDFVGDFPMMFAPDGQWLVGIGPEEVQFYRTTDGTEISFPLETGRFQGSEDVVVISTVEPA